MCLEQELMWFCNQEANQKSLKTLHSFQYSENSLMKDIVSDVGTWKLSCETSITEDTKEGKRKWTKNST